MADLEIERKFLVARLPPELPEGGRAIAQGYVAVAGDRSEVRVRSIGDEHRLTVKAGEGEVREEAEIAISRALFDALWPLTEGRRVEKVRREVALDGLTAELDVFGGELAGLLIVEVEFPSVAAAEAFSLPAWFGEEVTDDRAYRNQSLAQHGLPGGAAPASA